MWLAMNRNSFVFALFVFFLVSCSSIKQPSEVFHNPDFSEADVIENEKRRIEAIGEEKPVEALWRATLLADDDTVSARADIVHSAYEKAIADGAFFAAYRFYVTLRNVGYAKIDASPAFERALVAKALTDVPGLVTDRSLLPKTMADCVNATVTIWVDKGIKIQNGIGYADRVLGSGFFIDKRGYIVTNHHVISDLVDPKYEGYSRLFIKLASDQETRIPAKVIGYDSVLDLALLKCEIDPPFILELGSSAGLTVGEPVNCIGTPLGLHGTVTSGIVSAADRKLFTTGSVFQIDAAVNSGNSGGPCIDKNNRVQAIVFAGILQYQGLNFAIPVEYLRQDLPFLFSGGKRTLGWHGGFGHTKKEGMKNLGLEVQYTMPGGPLFRAGLMVDDVITEISGIRIYTIENLLDVLRNYGPETILSCAYERDGERRNVLLYLDERPEQPGYEIYKSDLLTTSFIPIFGMQLAPSSTMSRRQYTIARIIRGSVADESGFSELDPVYVADVDFNEDKSAMSVQMNTRKKKRGYLDVTIRIGAQLDSPYYF